MRSRIRNTVLFFFKSKVPLHLYGYEKFLLFARKKLKVIIIIRSVNHTPEKFFNGRIKYSL